MNQNMKGLKFYVGTSLANSEKAREASEALEAQGAVNLCKWFDLPRLHPYDPAAGSIRSQLEIDACKDADLVVIILPGGRGTHCELGAALASGGDVVMWLPVGPPEEVHDLLTAGGYSCVFHDHPKLRQAFGPDVAGLMVVVEEVASRSFFARVDESTPDVLRGRLMHFVITESDTRSFPWFKVTAPAFPEWSIETNLPISDVADYAARVLKFDVRHFNAGKIAQPIITGGVMVLTHKYPD